MDTNPSRQDLQAAILDLLRSNGQKAYRPKEIARQLDLPSRAAYHLFREVLDDLDHKNLVRRAKGGRYAHRPKPNRLEGILRVTRHGYGFVEVEGHADDLYVREAAMGNALDGDRVLVGLAAPARGDRRREAEVIEVVARHRTQAVGTFKQMGHFAFVVPDDQRLTQDIYVPREAFGGAQDGDKVVVSIDRFDDRKASPEGRILEVIGPADDPRVRVLSLALSMNVRSGFPEAVEAEAARIDTRIPAPEIARRLDLRHETIFTIDPVDAKDFDDAIHVTALENGNFEVGVHIADVSHYVRPGGAIDAEAYARGTSVYLVDRVLPMLPEKLSNEVCSLRPNEDKLTYSCIMEVTPQGKVERYDLRETVIHSKQRFTYEEAQDLIQGGFPDHPLAGTIVAAARLARTLTRKRMREGSVDFDMPEVRVVLDAEGNPVDIIRKDRIEANRLIEEFMLLANRTVAQHVGLRKSPPPFVYRIHDQPDAERIQALADYIKAFGYTLPLRHGNVSSKALNAMLEHFRGTPEAIVVDDAVLRAMAKARYAVENIGHYGLGFRHYSHFTSPIRRYPDLIAHRLLKRYASGGAAPEAEALEAQCVHCSEREKAATEAERESIRLKQVEYVRRHLGETFEGVVRGVTKFGIFVELSAILVEGMVHVRDMDDDYYEYDERTYRLTGTNGGRTFKPGTQVRVQVAGANVETREVDLLLVD